MYFVMRLRCGFITGNRKIIKQAFSYFLSQSKLFSKSCTFRCGFQEQHENVPRTFISFFSCQYSLEHSSINRGNPNKVNVKTSRFFQPAFSLNCFVLASWRILHEVALQSIPDFLLTKITFEIFLIALIWNQNFL